MRPLSELINTDEPAWPLVREWIAQAKNRVDVLPPADDAPAQLEAAQVTLRSPMGAIIYHTGGLLIDHGWLRVLGSGHPRLPRSLMKWNRDRSFDDTGNSLGFLLIADDVVGGFFAINGGALGQDVKNVHYFAPDTLQWESLQLGYTDFLRFVLSGDLEKFYGNFRWPDWQKDVEPLTGDQILFLWPPPWTSEGKNAANVHRESVSIAEAYGNVEKS